MQIPGYRIEGLVAEGGMSTVYLAVQESLGRRVALKVLRRFDNPQHAERFLHEARIIASLQHRNTITIHDVGTVGEQHYIAMEYLEGGSLADRIEHGMPPAEALDLLHSIAGCLDFVHRRDVVHRDIKPGNILFHSDGTPKLSDFGIAKQLDGDQELTMDGSAFGSPYYLSPEQAECRPLDGRSDIYGLGIVFYQMLTGRRPYAEDSHIETIVAHLSQPIPLLPEALSPYQGLLERMIAKRPEDRVGSAQELMELIRQTAPPGTGQTARKRGSRKPGTRKSRWRGLPKGMRKSWFPATLSVLLLLSFGLAAFLLPTAPAQDPETMAVADPVRVEPVARDPGTVVFERQVAVATPGLPSPEPGPAPEVAVAVIPGPADSEPRPVQMADLPDQAVEPDNHESPPQLPEAVVAEPDAPAQPMREQIDEWLSAGDSALRADRLTTPPNDNAYAHYLKVVELDRDNPGARTGIDRIAERYAELAGGALHNGDLRLAGLYLRRGSMVSPGDANLAVIRRELDEANRLAVAAQSQESADPVGPAPAASETRSVQFGDLSVRTRGPEGTGNIAKDFMNVWNSVFD